MHHYFSFYDEHLICTHQHVCKILNTMIFFKFPAPQAQSVCCHQACCILWAVSIAGGAVGVCSGGVSVFITHGKSDAWWLDHTEHTNKISRMFYSYFLSSKTSIIFFSVKSCCVSMWLTSTADISYTLSSASVKYLNAVFKIRLNWLDWTR